MGRVDVDEGVAREDAGVRCIELFIVKDTPIFVFVYSCIIGQKKLRYVLRELIKHVYTISSHIARNHFAWSINV